MHSAPSVTYPVGRSRWAAVLLLVAWLAGAAVSVAWTAQPQTDLTRSAVAILGVSSAGLLAGWMYWRAPRGALEWDGASWNWDGPAGRAGPGNVRVALDLQGLLLVRWQAALHAQWIWLARAAWPERWDDLRRAVYFRATPEALPVAEPPAAKT